MFLEIIVRARWEGQSQEAEEAQQATSHAPGQGVLQSVEWGLTSHAVDRHVTQWLFAEAFESGAGQARIPTRALKDRLKGAQALIESRELEFFDHQLVEADPDEQEQAILDAKNATRAFVRFCEKKEQETGTPVTIRIDSVSIGTSGSVDQARRTQVET